ncbi:BRO-N domain-containing protein [Bacillus sp. C1]
MKEWAIESGLIPRQVDKQVVTKLPPLGEVFAHIEFGDLEVLEIEGKPWFPAIECAEILGYKNTFDAIIKHCLGDGVAFREVNTEAGKREKKYISEGNLYRLIISSHLPSAQRFERWVFDEVLPSLRQNKGYVVEGGETQFIEKHFTGLSDNLKRMMVVELNENNYQGGILMNTTQVTFEVIDNKEQRNNLAERVEVLEKVKELLLLPNMELATTSQVAEFYGVDLVAINKISTRHKDELIQDGYITKYGKEIKDILGEDKMSLPKIEPKRGHFIIHYKGRQTKINYRTVGLFPKRAILRVGMLLRDSEVAKEVRSQLLNIEEKASEQIKVVDINEEPALQTNIGKAFATGDMMKVMQATMEYNNFKDRHINAVEEELKEIKEELDEIKPDAEKYRKFLDEEGLATLTTVGKHF